MRLGIYCNELPTTTFINNLIHGMAEKGIDVFVFGKGKGKYKYPSNVTVIAMPSGGVRLLIFTIKNAAKLAFRDYKLFKKVTNSVAKRSKNLAQTILKLSVLYPVMNVQPDIFHIQWIKALTLYPEFYLLDGKVIASLRGAQINIAPRVDAKLKKQYQELLPKCDHFHAVSKTIGDKALEYGATWDKIDVIKSGVRSELVASRVQVKTKEQKLKILSVGRFHWKKGYEYSLYAMKLLAARMQDFTYEIIANGSVPEEILYQLSELNLGDRIKITPGMPHKEVMNEMRNSDVFLLPSVEEGIANVVLEAMAMGVPVISTDCDGMHEVIQHGVNGFLVPVRDPYAIVDALLHFSTLSDSQKQILIMNGRDTIVKEHHYENNMNKFISMYNKVLQA